MRLTWSSLADGAAEALAGHAVEIAGWPMVATDEAEASYCLLAAEPVCCRGCLPTDPLACVEVFAERPVRLDSGLVALRGWWRRLPDDDPSGWRYQLTGAVAIGSADDAQRPLSFRVSRRGLLAAPLLCLSVGPAGAEDGAPGGVPVAESEAQLFLSGRPTIDMHSHAGGVLRVRQAEGHAPFRPLAGPMREGGLALACLAVVSDSPTHRVMPDRRIRAFRDPEPGELRAYAERGFRRLHDLCAAQGLAIVRSAADLAAVRSASPSVLVAAEGADFLEGDLAPLGEAYDRAGLRHLQLTHYRVNELGDIQTEAPVHGGLTAFGAEVIRDAQRMGVIVDVAHGTYDLVRQAVAVARRPLVLSHTSLTTAPRPRTRLVTPDHARLVAGTGGVVGIWPPAGLFPDLSALADGIARMADVVGTDHVGLGTDMMGLVGPSVLPDYTLLPQLAALLLDRFSRAEASAILGGNYLRVARACLPAG